MQTKSGFVVAVLVVLALGVVLGVSIGRSTSPIVEETRPKPPGPVSSFVDPEALYLVISGQPESGVDTLWFASGPKVEGIATPSGTIVAVAEVNVVAGCRDWTKCEPCDPFKGQWCPVPQPDPDPSPQIDLKSPKILPVVHGGTVP